jgi:hypothetical protein
VGFRIRVRVTATNAAGSTSAASNPTSSVVGVSGPKNTTPPVVSGTPVVGQTLTATEGTWSGTAPIKYAHQWLRCDGTGGGCASIAGATGLKWTLTSASSGHTLRFQVTATNQAGSTQAISVPTAVVGASQAPSAGCPTGTGPVSVASVNSPARLLVDRQQATPSTVQRGTRVVVLRYHVSDSCGQAVVGALVYATALPYGQLSNAAEQPTGATGWAQLDLRTLSGFPVSPRQQLITIFVRARKPGGNLLGGISTRRLFSVHVRL